MSVNLYNTGVSGLLAAQQQLATTGNNIANVNTEGYNRQRAEQNAATGLYNGGNYIGGGTYIENVRRVYDQFSYKEQLLSQTSLSNADGLHVDLSQLNEIMTFSGGAINSSLDKFYQTINSIADNPSDLGLRSMAITQAQVLSSDFKSLNANFDQIEKSTNGEIGQIASHISQISVEISKINEQVLHAQNPRTGQPNDLLDTRDRLVNELSKYTSVNTVVDDNGVMSVMIGNGATLVAGITPLSVGVQAGDPDPNKTTLTIVGSNSTVNLNGAVVGGSLAAKYEFRDQHLAQVRSEINRLAMVISETLNEAQHDGLDLNEQEGLDFFTDINSNILERSRVLAPSKNTGNLEARVNISDVSKVPTSEFEVKYDGVNFIMKNLTDNSTVNLGAAGASHSASIAAYGFEFIEDSGTPNAGDTFIIRPTENSASLMEVKLTDGAGISASTPIEVTASDNNVGGGSVSIVQMHDPLAAQTYASTTNTSLTVDVYDNGGALEYRVYDSAIFPISNIASGSYAPGGSVLVDLPPSPATAVFQLEIKGNPTGSSALAREEFSIADSFGVGNGNNATLMGLTQEKGIINGEQETFSQSLGVSTSTVGSKAKSAELVETTAQALFTKAYNRNQSTSGVNLDEEAANLLKFQQAYQASSQIISIANTIFDTLLQAVR
ncbi:flagellar hook-associated protein FlgK [Pseudocolwellia agarivorans]|uniref:flagellar hook-associated protein FlgK n=1 Tax=Pseudocolwellia agarivorans TaxID=1911682 RepID=UPI0009842D44|nr:flagellar hook-associated protein FlgK [Pseudocolwellia agarivorans]